MPSPIDINTFRNNPTGPLYRRFGKREYAESFLNGEFRFKNLIYYRELEDTTRQDPLEGISHIDSVGRRIVIEKEGKVIAEGHTTSDIAVSLRRPEIYNICCFSTEIRESHKPWGPWVVKLNNPALLFSQMADSIGQQAHLIWGQVSYYDSPGGPELIDATDIWRRKRTKFSDESEFRLGLIHNSPNDKNGTYTMDTELFSGEAELLYNPS